jgi:hypothetical protein
MRTFRQDLVRFYHVYQTMIYKHPVGAEVTPDSSITTFAILSCTRDFGAYLKTTPRQDQLLEWIPAARGAHLK